MLQSWFNIVVGVWLLVCGFIPTLQTPESMYVAGAVAMLFGFWGTGRSGSWQSTINGMIGIWLFLSGIWFSLYVPWNFLVFGAALVVLALWNSSEHPHPTHAIIS